jgi:hypothetical protein
LPLPGITWSRRWPVMIPSSMAYGPFSMDGIPKHRAGA